METDRAPAHLTLEKLLSKTNQEKRQTIADLLLLAANKPKSYSRLRSFTTTELWNYARRFVRTRQPDASELEVAQCISEIEQAFASAGIDIITFAQAGTAHSSDSASYYESEARVQNLVLRIFSSEIDASVKGLARSRTEAALFQVWIEELLANQEKATIALDMSKINHRLHKLQEQETSSRSLDVALVIETLARARLAYPVEDDNSTTVWPFWYTKSPSWLQGYLLALKEKKEKRS